MTPLILVDIDGTIALRGDRSPHDHDSSMEDAVNRPVVTLVGVVYSAFHAQICLISGRNERYRDVTEYWLRQHSLFPFRGGLLMRPLHDHRSDEEVKKDLYLQHIQPFYNVLYVFDDRNKVVKMWRDLGLTCLQVAEGAF